MLEKEISNPQMKILKFETWLIFDLSHAGMFITSTAQVWFHQSGFPQRIVRSMYSPIALVLTPYGCWQLWQCSKVDTSVLPVSRARSASCSGRSDEHFGTFKKRRQVCRPYQNGSCYVGRLGPLLATAVASELVTTSTASVQVCTNFSSRSRPLQAVTW